MIMIAGVRVNPGTSAPVTACCLHVTVPCV